MALSAYLLVACIISLTDYYEAARKLDFTIKGPKSVHDKVAIVGAGPAGVHMAYLLQQKGFKNVRILERSSRIGGKSQTIYHLGTPHDIGTVYLSPDYGNVMELLKKYVPNDLALLPPASIWFDQRGPITYRDYFNGFVFKSLFSKGIPKEKMFMAVLESIMRYIKLHQSIFGLYEGEIMPEPSEEKRKLIRGTFQDYIVRNNLTLLMPIFQASTTIQGFGHPDEIAALYGLMWNTPAVMAGFMKRLKGQKAGFYMLKSGFQNLWETIVQRENLQVTFDVEIYRVYREYRKNCQDIWLYKTEGDSNARWEHYDFLIWSPEMKSSMDRWRNVILKERKLFSGTSPTYFTSSIVETENQRLGDTPINYWLDNMMKKRDHTVWAQRDSYSTINGFKGPSYANGTFPKGPGNESVQSSVCYQMSKTSVANDSLKRILTKHLEKFSATNIKIVKLKTWSYFPRYSSDDMENGRLWRILEIQGKYAMWYIGSSVCFESVKSVLHYNTLIVENMEPPANN